MKKLASAILLLFSISTLVAQNHSHLSSNAFSYPDIEGHVTLKTDLHIHTVFSDGNVWPTIRVQEALRENLDAISLTEHLEYQPHKDDIPHPDRNLFVLQVNVAGLLPFVGQHKDGLLRRYSDGSGRMRSQDHLDILFGNQRV